MAPSKAATPPFSKDERVLCFHHEMLYEAKILDVKPAEADEQGTNAANASKLEGPQWSYKIHYKGWKSSWDDWVSQDRVRKFTDENKELATQLQHQFKLLQSGKSGAKQAGKKVTGKGAANGSDMGSARGSEERAAGAAAATTGRGPRRTRDYDLEHVSLIFLCFTFELCYWDPAVISFIYFL
jgi:mortality factor 4-like protein 1